MTSLFQQLRSRRWLAALDRELSRLPSADSPEHEEAAIASYLASLAEARRVVRASATVPFAAPSLHLGSGGHRIAEWLSLYMKGRENVGSRRLPHNSGAQLVSVEMVMGDAGSTKLKVA